MSKRFWKRLTSGSRRCAEAGLPVAIYAEQVLTFSAVRQYGVR
jgi:hypothetical protein